MKRLIMTAAAVLLAAGSLPLAMASGPGHEEHEHAFSAGEPGDPRAPSRTIQVTMQEGDGKMTFVPNHIDARLGEQIKFVLYNSGELDHEFVLATVEENKKHAKAMEMNPEMEHDDPNARRVAPKKSDAIVWKFTKPGRFEYACLIPGHYEAGMFGTVDVK
ncbi:MAG: cupredoxin family protein [Methylocapsa sp.]|nr:cupredoxin family protein [Methylocapsa sp.]